MENKPTIYILAGANGIGKTSVNPFFIPKGVTYINADDIARQLRERLGSVNVQELANAEAIDRMNVYCKKTKFCDRNQLGRLGNMAVFNGHSTIGLCDSP